MKILAPTACPSCGDKLERVKDQLFCRNSDECPAQSTKRLQNFCKKLKFKGFGEATLQKLEMVGFNDLLSLRPETASKKGFSEHMSEKLVNTIKSRLTEGVSPNEFLAACSIPMIGDGAMRKLSFNKIGNITYDMCKEAGIGDKAARSLIDWINSEWNLKYKEYWDELLVPEKKVEREVVDSKGVIVCITGKLNDFKNRKDAASFLESQGFEVKSSVTKAVNYLICEDGTRGSSFKKATEYGIPVTTIKKLIEEI